MTCSRQNWNLSFHSVANCFQLISISTSQPLHVLHHHFCSFYSYTLSTYSAVPSVFLTYHKNSNMPWGFFFSPTWTLLDLGPIQQANVTCDQLFVIINESSAEFRLWYISCCIARSLSFNEWNQWNWCRVWLAARSQLSRQPGWPRKALCKLELCCRAATRSRLPCAMYV